MKRVVCWSVLAGLLSVFGLVRTSGVVWAADDKLPAPKKVAAGTDEKDPAKALAAMLQKRNDLGKRVEELMKKYEKADPAERKKIEAEHERIVKDFMTGLLPKMLELAIPLYLKDGKNEDAEDVVLGHLKDLFDSNKYKEVIDLGDKLIAKGRKHVAILTFDGVSHFAIQDFDKAKELLTQAQEVSETKAAQESGESEIYTQLGLPYLQICGKYAGLWKKEQEIRAKEAKAPKGEELPQVVFKTSKGDIVLELFENQAPNTVANFIGLVEKHKYDGTLFHRVIPNFMAQGGDPNTLDDDPRNDGTGGPGYRIACECARKDARMHFQGSLSMAHAGKDTGGSQFFLTDLPTNHLNGLHTVFGRVVEGMDVVLDLKVRDKIISATVLRKRNHKYEPEILKGE